MSSAAMKTWVVYGLEVSRVKAEMARLNQDGTLVLLNSTPGAPFGEIMVRAWAPGAWEECEVVDG